MLENFKFYLFYSKWKKKTCPKKTTEQLKILKAQFKISDSTCNIKNKQDFVKTTKLTWYQIQGWFSRQRAKIKKKRKITKPLDEQQKIDQLDEQYNIKQLNKNEPAFKKLKKENKLEVISPPPLDNFDNLCYANCAIQQLYNVKFLVNEFLQCSLKLNDNIKIPITNSLVNLFKQCYKVQTKDNNNLNDLVIKLKTNIGIKNEEFKSSGQKDVFEFLQKIIEATDLEIEKVKNSIDIKNPINNLKTLIKQKSTCLNCNNEYIMEYNSTNFVLNFPQEKFSRSSPSWNLQFILKSLFSDVLLQSKCECSNQDVDKKISSSVINYPKLLFLNLARFSKERVKRQEPIEVPETILLPFER